ncbi:hypothetical protein M422DRAFT_71579 [Sphaerobolus stellatus SS14]|uniref:Uncharacterized protein n=1 Tax=Sphaerobolus stellatus (strain SS14) TaxID=990650 RepID=A0A0C9UQ85_SPHS4|nr:hypothetical protein M422DRAFT_71579 [Sphaerobolus stellatus SS14]
MADSYNSHSESPEKTFQEASSYPVSVWEDALVIPGSSLPWQNYSIPSSSISAPSLHEQPLAYARTLKSSQTVGSSSTGVQLGYNKSVNMTPTFTAPFPPSIHSRQFLTLLPPPAFQTSSNGSELFAYPYMSAFDVPNPFSALLQPTLHAPPSGHFDYQQIAYYGHVDTPKFPTHSHQEEHHIPPFASPEPLPLPSHIDSTREDLSTLPYWGGGSKFARLFREDTRIGAWLVQFRAQAQCKWPTLTGKALKGRFSCPSDHPQEGKDRSIVPCKGSYADYESLMRHITAVAVAELSDIDEGKLEQSEALFLRDPRIRLRNAICANPACHAESGVMGRTDMWMSRHLSSCHPDIQVCDPNPAKPKGRPRKNRPHGKTEALTGEPKDNLGPAGGPVRRGRVALKQRFNPTA